MKRGVAALKKLARFALGGGWGARSSKPNKFFLGKIYETRRCRS